VVEEAEPQQVDDEPGQADAQHHQRLLHLVGLDEALDGLQQDGEAQAGQEDGVDQGPHHLGPDPAEGVLLGGLGPPGEALGHQGHHQGQHVRQHVEGVRQHGQRRGQPAHHHLQHHEEEGQRQHAQQPGPVAAPAGHGDPRQAEDRRRRRRRRSGGAARPSAASPRREGRPEPGGHGAG
uniref:Uncharacterized protein n=1 Tax=Ornithorhynchus anatinus TaxID=9258 RepID=A0A6I8PNN2_ORNAN